MYSEKSGEKDILGEYKSNSMKGWKLWTVILYLPLSWTVFSLDFFQISGIFSVSMVKLEKLVQSFYTSEQRGKGLVSFVLVLLSNTNKQQENNFYRIKNLWKLSLLSSVQFSRSVVSDSLWLHGLQNTRLPCPSPTPGACSNSCPSNQWCHPTSSSSVVPFSSCLQSFPASGSFQMSQFFTSSGQSSGDSASASVLPMNIQDQFPLGLTGWISRDSQESSPTPQFKSFNSLVLSFLYSPTLTSIHDYWKNHSFD